MKGGRDAMMTMKIGKDLFDYINDVRNPRVKQAMKRRVQEYTPKHEFADKFEALQEKYFFSLFAAEWSPECQAQIPTLAKLLLVVKNSNLVVKVIDYDGNRDIAEEMGVLRIPTIIVHDRSWRELGRFVEKPQRYATIEEELWFIIERRQRSI